MKSRIRHLLAIVTYFLGVDCLFYWFNRKAKRIVTFHNVLPDELCEEVRHVGVSMSLSDFSTIITEIGKRFRYSVDIDDCTTATITFDDGTRNEYEVAGTYLMAHQIPAVLFLTGDIVDAKECEMPIIEQLSVWNSFVPLDVARAAFGTIEDRRDLWMNHVQAGYRKDWQTRGRQFLAHINSIYPVSRIIEGFPPAWRHLRMTGVTESELADLRNHGWTIGWHTKTHFPLGYLPLDERRKELDCPVEMRKCVLGYPYGDIDAVGKETPQLAAEMGYPAAVSNFPNESPYHGRHFMLRMAPPVDKYELHFLLSGVKYFLQSFKLLPKPGSSIAKHQT